jgi:hypothetical protein
MSYISRPYDLDEFDLSGMFSSNSVFNDNTQQVQPTYYQKLLSELNLKPGDKVREILPTGLSDRVCTVVGVSYSPTFVSIDTIDGSVKNVMPDQIAKLSIISSKKLKNKASTKEALYYHKKPRLFKKSVLE